MTGGEIIAPSRHPSRRRRLGLDGACL